MPGVRPVGVACHIGSQITDLAPLEAAFRKMRALVERIRGEGLAVERLDLGGGLGVPYVASDDPPGIGATVQSLAEAVLAACERHGYPAPQLVLEPGRSIVGNAGLTVYAVGTRKVVPGVRTYVAVDGGMADNPRPITYGADYSATLANREAGTDERVTLVGRYCESGDVLIPEVCLRSPQAGDLVAVFTTGAYNYSMASNYNRVGRPAMLLVHDGQADVIVEREQLADLVRLDRLPPRLR
jgi:diaminopimelate decarboxylase